MWPTFAISIALRQAGDVQLKSPLKVEGGFHGFRFQGFGVKGSCVQGQVQGSHGVSGFFLWVSGVFFLKFLLRVFFKVFKCFS